MKYYLLTPVLLSLLAGSLLGLTISPSSLTITPGKSVTFTAYNSAIAVYYWRLPEGVKGVSGKGTNTQTAIFPGEGSYNISVSTSESSRSPTAVATITVKEDPPVRTVPGRTIVSGGSTPIAVPAPVPVPESTLPGRTLPGRTSTGRSI